MDRGFYDLDPWPDPTVIRDSTGYRVARIEERTPGIETLVDDFSGEALGRYEAESDRTYDALGSHFSYGNRLLLLLGLRR
ncbi:hypothetical protein FBQ97_17540 [Acidobacteria bacterium ACD]|nr:MAG: hypothetical protein EDX89_11265 [Acidobacteriota bacterium]MDL1951598.1 hypothetical protein [Acidobacteria bacterium ACD]